MRYIIILPTPIYCRLVLTCVSASDKDFGQQWIEEVRLSHNVKESLQFIMKSSTNGQTLAGNFYHKMCIKLTVKTLLY